MSSLTFKLKYKTGQAVIKDLTLEHKISDLLDKISTISKIPKNSIGVLCGFPPKPLTLSDHAASIQSCGLKSGDTLIVEERAPTVVNRDISSRLEPATKGRHHITEEQEMACAGTLLKQVVPADNSCLFTSIGFVMGGKIDVTSGSYMRQIIAQEVSGDSENYSEAILGKPPREYCEWIQKPESWGGAIELAVMSHYYGLEIAVVDTLNAIINRFGEDQHYGQRVFLLFDGIHYDPLYLEPNNGGNVQTIFSTADDRVLRNAEELAVEAQASRQFTDVNHFTLRCMICDTRLTGQVAAQGHARDTGHMNFGEIA